MASSARAAASGAAPVSSARRRSSTSRQSGRSVALRSAASGGSVATKRPAAAAADRVQVAALDQRRDRLAQRRARDVELVGQLALGGQSRAGREDAEADRPCRSRSTVSSKVVSGATGSKTALNAASCGMGASGTARSAACDHPRMATNVPTADRPRADPGAHRARGSAAWTSARARRARCTSAPAPSSAAASPPPTSSATPGPSTSSAARAPRVWDVDGNEMWDFHNGFGSMVQGHAHPGDRRAR